jgi:hypothetical protein
MWRAARLSPSAAAPSARWLGALCTRTAASSAAAAAAAGGEPATVPLIQHAEASPEVRAVYDDIMEKRAIPDVNNFWKAIANHPPTLRRTWSVRGRRPQPAA